MRGIRSMFRMAFLFVVISRNPATSAPASAVTVIDNSNHTHDTWANSTSQDVMNTTSSDVTTETTLPSTTVKADEASSWLSQHITMLATVIGVLHIVVFGVIITSTVQIAKSRPVIREIRPQYNLEHSQATFTIEYHSGDFLAVRWFKIHPDSGKKEPFTTKNDSHRRIEFRQTKKKKSIQEMNQSEAQLFVAKYVPGQFSLVINRFSKKDEGVYVCQVQNKPLAFCSVGCLKPKEVQFHAKFPVPDIVDLKEVKHTGNGNMIKIEWHSKAENFDIFFNEHRENDIQPVRVKDDLWELTRENLEPGSKYTIKVVPKIGDFRGRNMTVQLNAKNEPISLSDRRPTVLPSVYMTISHAKDTIENTQEKQDNAGEFEGFIQLREALIENHPTQVKQEEEEEKEELKVNTADQDFFELETQESQNTTKKIILQKAIDLTQEDDGMKKKHNLTHRQKTMLWKKTLKQLQKEKLRLIYPLPDVRNYRWALDVDSEQMMDPEFKAEEAILSRESTCNLSPGFQYNIGAIVDSRESLDEQTPDKTPDSTPYINRTSKPKLGKRLTSTTSEKSLDKRSSSTNSEEKLEQILSISPQRLPSTTSEPCRLERLSSKMSEPSPGKRLLSLTSADSLGLQLRRQSKPRLSPASFRNSQMAYNMYKKVEIDFATRFWIHNEDYEEEKLILIQGDSGQGKTTYCQHFTYKWAKSTDYDTFCIFLPLRKVKKCMSVNEMIKQMYGIENALALLNGVKGVIILDGIDEVESLSPKVVDFILQQGRYCKKEDGQFQGKVGIKYENIKLIVTSRPYKSKINSVLGADMFFPDLQITLNGVTEESCKTFIIKFFRRNQEDERYCNYIEEQVEKFGAHKEFLKVPIYLVLICLAFHKDFEDERSGGISENRIPNSKTKLFNIFMMSYLARLYDRLHPNATKNPIDLAGTPFLIEGEMRDKTTLKSFLICLCRMFYDAVLNDKYDFTATDFDKFSVNTEYVQALGLFSVIQEEEDDTASPFHQGKRRHSNTQYFMKHKMFSEYLAGLHLAFFYEENESICKEITALLKDPTQPKHAFRRAEKRPLHKCIETLQNVILFAVGLSQPFFNALLKEAAYTCVIQSKPVLDFYLHPFDNMLLCEGLATVHDSSEKSKSVENFLTYLCRVDVVNSKCTYIGYKAEDIVRNDEVKRLLKNASVLYIQRCVEKFYKVKCVHTEDTRDKIDKILSQSIKHANTFVSNYPGLFLRAALPYITCEGIKEVKLGTYKSMLKTQSSIICDLDTILNAFPNAEKFRITNCAMFPHKDSTADREHPVRKIMIKDTKIQDWVSVIQGLHRCKQIEELEIQECNLPLLEMPFPDIIAVNAYFTSLNLENNNCNGLDVIDVMSVLNMPSLKKINISSNQLEVNVVEFLQHMSANYAPTLESLIMTNCLKQQHSYIAKVLSENRIPIPNQSTALTHIDISQNCCTGDDVVHLLKIINAPSLKKLNVSSNELGTSVGALLRYLNEKYSLCLETLEMWQCELSGIVSVMKTKAGSGPIHFNMLKKLYICGNKDLSEEDIHLFKSMASRENVVIHDSFKPLYVMNKLM